MILVTGGAGFIGANFLLDWFKISDEPVVNLDALTYAGNLANLSALARNEDYIFIHGDINNAILLNEVFQKYRPRALINFAAESHVDRSIQSPDAFVQTNIVGTFNLLKVAKDYWLTLDEASKKSFRFLHVSTDEVFGSLESNEPPFAESNAYKPNSPYSATKAASDHLVRAWHHTYGFPTLISNCSNNYGPYQYPEKLIPLMIANALSGKPLPIYGDGLNIRDWLYVSDHCSAIRTILAEGKVGETYNVGGWNEITNIEIVRKICDLLDQIKPDPAGSYKRLVAFIKDRPGHDRRYAINASKIEMELGWRPSETFDSGLRKTVAWYLENTAWISHLKNTLIQYSEEFA